MIGLPMQGSLPGPEDMGSIVLIGWESLSNRFVQSAWIRAHRLGQYRGDQCAAFKWSGILEALVVFAEHGFAGSYFFCGVCWGGLCASTMAERDRHVSSLA